MMRFDGKFVQKLVVEEFRHTISRKLVFDNVCTKLGHSDINYEEFTKSDSIKYYLNTYLFYHYLESGKLCLRGYNRDSIYKELNVADEIVVNLYFMVYYLF
jgi:hypothetical protein